MTAQTNEALPFGIRDTQITPYTDAAGTTLGTLLDNPNAQSMTFEEAEDYETLRGDDKVIAMHGKGPSVSWEMDNGGISLGAYKTMNGGTVTTSGVTPNTVTTYTKKVTDTRPYFKAEGQSISDLGGDFHGVLHKCKADGGLSGELTDGAFWVTKAQGTAFGAADDTLYDFIINETETPIA